MRQYLIQASILFARSSNKLISKSPTRKLFTYLLAGRICDLASSQESPVTVCYTDLHTSPCSHAVEFRDKYIWLGLPFHFQLKIQQPDVDRQLLLITLDLALITVTKVNEEPKRITRIIWYHQFIQSDTLYDVFIHHTLPPSYSNNKIVPGYKLYKWISFHLTKLKQFL
jgi:hypothetical protein